MSFQSQVVIVTGASSGIGAATAIAFAAEGAKVAIVGRRMDKLQQVAAECGRKGSKALVIVADVSVRENCRRIINETISEFGRIDVLVNNAGIPSTAGILAPNAMEVYKLTMATNLDSAVLLTHLAAPHLVESKGNIINVSSIAAQRVVINDSFSYCVSKAGMDHFTRSVALELAPKGVRCNTVAPGPVKTDVITKAGITGEKLDMLMKMLSTRVPMKKMGEPEELADLILFLASHKARSITGCTYTSDNGARMTGTTSPQQQQAMFNKDAKF